MAKTAAERRAARRRKQQDRGRHRATEAHPPSVGEAVGRLVAMGAAAAAGPDADPQLLARIAAELAAADPAVDTHGHAARLLVALLGELWEDGWQPADVVHVVRRGSSARQLRLALRAIAAQTHASGALARAPGDWAAQLHRLGVGEGPQRLSIGSWRREERLTGAEAWREALTLAGRLGFLGPVERLAPPPSAWRRPTGRPPTRHVDGGDPRVLGRIRGLLAKAESTEFPDEAEALTSKAQELMTRYAVDAAVLEVQHGARLADEVVCRRLHLDNPYPEEKARLLTSVARANGGKVVWHDAFGMATAVGLPVDLDLVELLFTSLLVQATRAMTETGRAGGRGTRSPSFRRAFLAAYAVRIGERLTEARESATAQAEQTHGTALVPVLRAREEAVDGVFIRLFPETRTTEARISNARGWHAGRLAAEHADLRPGHDEVTGR